LLYAVQVHRVDPAREDVYLASVQDQEAVLAGSPDFHGRSLLQSHLEPGVFWLIDGWTDEAAMEMGLASARTLSSVAALIEEPQVILAEGDELARRPSAEIDGATGAPFFLIAETWVKDACRDDYISTVREQASRLGDEEGFRRRTLLAARDGVNHFYVVDEWAGERAAYESYQRRPVTEVEATRFLSLLAERRRPVLATGLQVAV
jgi:quinol monooxygenase YgiN